ncbi:MAG: hypothetical protein ACSLEM_04650 [Candidatus Malihini olakiniferum]
MIEHYSARIDMVIVGDIIGDDDSSLNKAAPGLVETGPRWNG